MHVLFSPSPPSSLLLCHSFPKHKCPFRCTSHILLGGKRTEQHECTWTNPTLQLSYLLPGFNELSNIYYFASSPITDSLHNALFYTPYVWLTPLQSLSLLLCLFALLTFNFAHSHCSSLSVCIPAHFLCIHLFLPVITNWSHLSLNQNLRNSPKYNAVNWVSLLRFSSQNKGPQKQQ